MTCPRGGWLLVTLGSFYGCAGDGAAATEGDQQITLSAGIPDDFALPPDSSTPSSALEVSARTFFRTQVPNASDLCLAEQPSSPAPMFQDFDLLAKVNGGACNTLAGHTFSALPANIVKGVLTLIVRPGAVCLGPDAG